MPPRVAHSSCAACAQVKRRCSPANTRRRARYAPPGCLLSPARRSAGGGDLQNGSTASRLYAAIRREMPYDAPGSLSGVQYYDVTAFLVSRNDLLPTDTIVDPSTAPKLRFTLRRS